MAKLLTQAKGDFLLMEHPVNMHEEVTQWISELEFCNTELLFLQNLLNRYFLQISVKKRIEEFKILESKLKTFHTKYFREFHDAVLRHEHDLSELDKDIFSQNGKTIQKAHKKHKLGMTAFMGSVKKIKKEIFTFIEKQLKEVKNITKGFEDGTLTL